jgi:hypothetical protein
MEKYVFQLENVYNVWWKLMKTDEILNSKKLTFNLKRDILKELKDEKWMNWIGTEYEFCTYVSRWERTNIL